MDRCALFVDASYVLADGAMAVHGTRRRQSVSWDYGGLLQLLSNLSMERTGLPLLRCYWYESVTDEHRGVEQEALADMPGVKLRLVGAGDRVEGVMRRDLTTLARNQAVSDAMVVSSAEELTRVVADVQDLGMRVTLLHLAADGNWTISRTLRQECDDVIEISPAHLRPYVELIPGAEPPRVDERSEPRPYTNGHVPGGQTNGYAPLPPESSNGHRYQAPPGPAFADYQQPGYQQPDYQRPDNQRPDNQRPVPRLSPPAPGDQEPAAPAAPAAVTPPAPAPAPMPPAPAPVAPPSAPPVREPGPAPAAAVPPAAGGDLLAGLAAMPVKRPDVPDPGTVSPEPSPAFREPSPAAPREPAFREPPPAPQVVPHEPATFSGPAKRAASPASMSRPASFPPASELPTRREFSAYQNLFAAPVTEVPPSTALALPAAAEPAPAPEPAPLPEPASAPAPAPASAAPASPPVSPAPVPPPAPMLPEPEPASAAPMRPEPAPPEPAPALPVAGLTSREERSASRPYPADLSGYTPGALRDPFLAEADPVAGAYADGYPASGGYPAVPQSAAAQQPLAQPSAAQPSGQDASAYFPDNSNGFPDHSNGFPGHGNGLPGHSSGGHSNGFSGHGNGSYSGPQPAVSLRHPGTGATPAPDSQPPVSQPPVSPPRVPGGQTVALGRPTVLPGGVAAVPETAAPDAPPASASTPPAPAAPLAPVPEFAHPGYADGYADGSSQAGTRTAGFFGTDPLGRPDSLGRPDPVSRPNPLDRPDPASGPDPLGVPGPSATGPSTGDILVPVDPAGPGSAFADPGMPESPGAPSNPGMPANGSVPASNGHASGASLHSVPGLAPAAQQQPAISLADAVQAAHDEGREFGGSVARDAPTLWLEAVLARKPRMPSDLEARLLQGSSLPIDFLLHDEVRHALRRGFWDALERARR